MNLTQITQQISSRRLSSILGSDVKKHQDSATEMLRAVLQKDCLAMWDLLENGADPETILTTSGRTISGKPSQFKGTSLHFASISGDIPMIKLLLAHQAKVNTICAQGSTALFYAIQKGHVDAVDLLLDNEADYTIRNTIGCDAMLAASVYDKTLIIELLLQKGVSPIQKLNTSPIQSSDLSKNKITNL